MDRDGGTSGTVRRLGARAGNTALLLRPKIEGVATFAGIGNRYRGRLEATSYCTMNSERCSSPQSQMAWMTGPSVDPYSVSEYSVLGGTTG